MAKITKIILQQMVTMDQTSITASRYPRYTVVLGNSISSITAGELTASVDAAAASAAAAKASEIAAKDSEINAKESEQEAAISEQNAETSAGQAAASAGNSANSASAAELQALEAKKQAGFSKDSATAADVAAQNAEQSRLLAEQAKAAADASAAAAKLSETEASDHAINAGAFANTSEQHAAAAKASELAAKESENSAAGSATTAGDKAVDATAEADRAKAEADRAMQVVDSKLDKEDIAPFVKVYKTLSEATEDLSNRVLGEKILVWTKTSSKYGWYKVAGTIEAPTLELEFEESKLLSVNNVQPDESGNVQVTLPGGNPSLWLGEVTWFPYSKDQGIGYSGVLPADGRLVLRVDYPDTWEAIEAGLIPSVSEEEWQAGATLYFSTGDGSTNFRLPDMMQGQAFRAADKNEDDAARVKEQIPYISLVNGKSPDDTGAVTISAEDIQGFGSMSLQDADNVNILGGTAKFTADYSNPVVVESVNPTIQFKETDNEKGFYNFIVDGGNFRMQLGTTNKYAYSYTYDRDVMTFPAIELTNALPIPSGGTGGNSALEARRKLEVPKTQRTALTVDLNDLVGPDSVGFYPQPISANATLANNYPETSAGSLEVMHSGANGSNESTQIYYPYNQDHYWKRRLTPLANGGVAVSSPWKKFSADDDIVVTIDTKLDNKFRSFGINTTGMIESNDANDIQRNGFFAGAGVDAANYARPYAPGLVLRRVNDVYQIQWDDSGRSYARAYTGGTWGNWNTGVIAGDYGLGTTVNTKPTSPAAGFIADSDGLTTWAPSNGVGMQASYAPNRTGQFYITASGDLFSRFILDGNPQSSKTATPWKQSVSTQDETYYPWTAGEVTPYITFPGCSSSAAELRVKVSKTNIHVVGIIRWPTPQTGSHVVMRMMGRAPGGQGISYCPYQMVLASVGMRSAYTEAGNGLTANIVFNHATNTDSWIMVNHTITFGN